MSQCSSERVEKVLSNEKFSSKVEEAVQRELEWEERRESVPQFERSQGARSKKSEEAERDSYVIDYMAFNYINKVIDRPNMWSKFVHKRVPG